MTAQAMILLAVLAFPVGSADAFEPTGAVPAKTDNPGDIRALADRFIDALRLQGYSFLTEDKLGALHREIESFAARFQPAQTDPSEHQLLIKAIDRYVPELFVHRQSDPYSSQWDTEGAYRKFRDLVNTFKWQLWRALTRAPLSAGQLKQRQTQHDWLRHFVAEVPARPGDWLPAGVGPEGIRAWASERLEQMLADPLGLLRDPMTDPQFAVFQEWMRRSAANGLVGVVSDVLVRGLGARAHVAADVEDMYQYPFDIVLPFEDEVTDIYGGGEGSGPHLVFRSNARFRGQEVYLDARSRPVFDLGVGGVCPVPGDKDPASRDFIAWWEKEQAVGDLAYDDAAADIVAIRGARLAELKVANWFEADRVSDAELRRVIAEHGTSRISVARLPPVNGPRRVGGSDPRFFVVLLNRDNCLAVLDLQSREFNLHFVSRSR